MTSRSTTPFTAAPAAVVIAGVGLTGRRPIVTGGASGIGIEHGPLPAPRAGRPRRP